jgi:hypothetical protein
MCIGTLGGGGGGGGCGELCALDAASVSSKWIKDEGAGFKSGIDEGGNPGVWVGVLGDESCAETGEESVSDACGLPGASAESRSDAPGVRFESITEPMPESRFSLVKPLMSLDFGDLMVLAFEPLDLTEIFESLVVLPNHELLELGLASASTSSWTFVIWVGVSFRCCENSVSGGLGGRSSFGILEERGGVK